MRPIAVTRLAAAGLVLALAACGRIAFDPTSDARGDGRAVLGRDAANGDAMPVVANLVFVTSTTVDPTSLGGLAGADAVCNARAAAGGMSGNFVAWLSSSSVNAAARLGSARGWQRRDGLMVADQVSDLSANNLVNAISLDELGNDVAAGAYAIGDNVLTATDGGGVTGTTCGDFTSNTGNVTCGIAGLAHADWSTRVIQPCSTPSNLYCFQTDFTVALTPPHTTGRLAFVSAGQFTPNTGLATADAICAQEASAAGKPGTFLALLPPNGMPAATRFDGSLGPWVRPDGVALAETGDELLNSAATAPFDTELSGATVDGYVMTGDDSPAFHVIGEDCSGWTDSSAGGNFGAGHGTGGFMFNETSGNCTTPLPVFCLQQ